MAFSSEFYQKNSSILITGASSGIGAELARQLAPHCKRLFLVARRKEKLDRLVEELSPAGVQAIPILCDVSDRGQVQTAWQQIMQQDEAVDIAFLNAGFSAPFSLRKFNATRIQHLFEVNLFGVIYWLDLLFPAMIARHRGTIAVTSSLAASRSFPSISGYSASKAALSSLIDGLRPEAQVQGLQLSLIEPGFIKTELTEEVRFPMPFLVEVEHAADLILDGVAKGRHLIRFPWQMAAAAKLWRHLPRRLFDLVVAKAMTR